MLIEKLQREQNENILSFKEQIGEHETKISELTKRAETIAGQLNKAREVYQGLKQDQCNAIASGEDYFSLSHDVKESFHNVETFEGALSTIQELKAGEEQAIKDLNGQINLCLIELDKLEAVTLVDRYNKSASELAQVFKEYDLLAHEISRKHTKEMRRGRVTQLLGYEVLSQVVKRNSNRMHGTGLLFVNLTKLHAVLPGENIILPIETEYHFNEKTDCVKY